MKLTPSSIARRRRRRPSGAASGSPQFPGCAIAAEGYRSLDENQRVEFDMTQGQKGPQAENVRQV
jgi:hypothetical protein